MFFYDTHFHLKKQDEIQQILSEGRKFNLTKFFLVAADWNDSQIAANIAAQEADVYAVVGVHPHSCQTFDGDFTPFTKLLQQSKVVAVGEIGLDYYYDFSTPQEQIPVFSQFLELAKEIGKPPVIHCREAFGDCIPILREIWTTDCPFEIHSFTGSKAELKAVLDLGAYISFNGMVTFNNADNIRDLVHYVPNDRLLLETDSPFLTPQPYRKLSNAPKYIPIIAQKIAEIKELHIEQIAEITCQNADAFFGLSAC